MAISRINGGDDAIWARSWSVADATERVALLSTATSPLGPKRGDTIFQIDTSTWYLYLGGDLVQVGGVLSTARGGTGVDISINALPLGSGQIEFPATQNPSANANTLDDYEEGTWTPTIGGSGGQSGQAYSLQDGMYVKVGQLVTAWFSVTLSTLGTITGAVTIEGLPFTSFNDANAPNTAAVFWDALTVAKQIIQVNVVGNSTQGVFVELAAPAISIINTLAQADLSNTTNLRATLVYRAAA